MISSCTLPEHKTSWLVGRVYVNEEASDKIEFVGEKKFVIIFGRSFYRWTKGVPYTFEYSMYGHDNQFAPVLPTSGDGFNFPYRTLGFSDSKEEILFTERRSGKSGVFKRVK
jgi:hypothetical protein